MTSPTLKQWVKLSRLKWHIASSIEMSTRRPLPAMMPWQDVMVQLIDTPPVTADYMEPYMQGLIRSADLALLLFDPTHRQEPPAGAKSRL